MATDPRHIESRVLETIPPELQRSSTRKSSSSGLRFGPRGLGIRPRPRFRLDPRSVSLLDEAHRRTRDNMLAIERRLRLGPGPDGQPTTEALLTEFRHRLQLLADLHRTLCRSGRFDQVDLAVYLRRITSALSAACGRGLGAPPDGAGWVVDAEGSRLIWIDDDCEAHPRLHPTGDLPDVLKLLPRAQRAVAHRAVCAATMLFPPSLFKWKSPAHGPRACGCDGATAGSAVAVELDLSEHPIKVLLGVADRGAGLPPRFDAAQRSALALQIADSLGRLWGDADTRPAFEVSLETQEGPAGRGVSPVRSRDDRSV